MSRRRWSGLALLTAAQLLHCTPNGTPQTGSNTNWLTTCSADADCRPESSCICGTCTTACSATVGCAQLGARCTDTSVAPGSIACARAAEAPPDICLPSCSDASDCAADQACVSGVCVSGCDHASDVDQAPYASLTIPGRIELENFDLGGQCIAYWDRERASQHNGATRQNEWLDVHSDFVESPGDEVIGFSYPNEWAEYTLDIERSGSYDFELRYASAAGAASTSVSLELDEENIGSIELPPTADFGTFTSAFMVDVPLRAGRGRVLRVHFGLYVNQSWLEVQPSR